MQLLLFYFFDTVFIFVLVLHWGRLTPLEVGMIQLCRNTPCVTLCIVDSSVASFPLSGPKGFSVLKRHGCPVTPGTPKSSWVIL